MSAAVSLYKAGLSTIKQMWQGTREQWETKAIKPFFFLLVIPFFREIKLRMSRH